MRILVLGFALVGLAGSVGIAALAIGAWRHRHRIDPYLQRIADRQK